MKTVIIASLVAVNIAWAAAEINSYDEIYKTDGTVVKGTIIERELGKLLLVETLDGPVSVKEAEVNIIREDVPLVFSEKSPALALVLSAIFPGLGQHYSGNYTIGVTQEVACFIGAMVLSSALGRPSHDQDHSDVQAQKIIGGSLVAGSYIWSLIDAPLGASRATKRNMEKAYAEAISE